MSRLPPCSYTIPLPGAGPQALTSTDRPVCAAIAALAFGGLRGKLVLDPPRQVASFLNDYGVLDGRRDLWISALRGTKHRGPTPDEVMGLRLDTYQRIAIESASSAGVIYSMACGLGKTATAAALAASVGGPRCWIICPLNAMGTWKRAAVWLKTVFPEVQIMSMDSAHNAAGLSTSIGGVIIFDEAHMLGEAKTRRTKAAHELRMKFDYGICLTGTLLHGGIHKALSVLDLAVPGASLFSSQWKAGEYFNCLVKKTIGPRTVTALEKPSGPNRARFVEYLSRFAVAMDYTHPLVRAAFQVPEQDHHLITFGTPWGELDDEIAALAERYAEEGGTVPHMAEIAHLLSREGFEEKGQWILENLEADPAVIFANYHDTLDYFEGLLNENLITFVRVDGSVTGAARVEAERRFQAGEVQVFLGQMAAASVSMNLQRARFSIAADHSWRAADYAQALARTARRGQGQRCHHFDLVANRWQAGILHRIRSQSDFDSTVAEYQRLRAHFPRPTTQQQTPGTEP